MCVCFSICHVVVVYRKCFLVVHAAVFFAATHKYTVHFSSYDLAVAVLYEPQLPGEAGCTGSCFLWLAIQRVIAKGSIGLMALWPLAVGLKPRLDWIPEKQKWKCCSDWLAGPSRAKNPTAGPSKAKNPTASPCAYLQAPKSH